MTAACVTQLSERYQRVRTRTEFLCRTLSPEDMLLQPMPDASPVKWHLAHTAWFFEEFLLRNRPNYRSLLPDSRYLFNSYYESVGARHPRPQRGLLSRPSLDEVFAYRRHVDEQMQVLLAHDLPAQTAAVVELGLNHEEQHQELILTDILCAFSRNPLRPAYDRHWRSVSSTESRAKWLGFASGLRWIGHAGDEFAFDNESPQHRVFLEEFSLASRPVTVGEYRQFMEDGGYQRAEFWLSDGWQACQRLGWTGPEYWDEDGLAFGLAGIQPLDMCQPVTHVSFYEADAFARWAGCRLPTEAEWEIFALAHPNAGIGAVWEWTASPYVAYPGYRPAAGALGEYNGKFMCNQMVLRGASVATPPGHSRPTYRNFFPPETRWQFTGLRLARDGDPTQSSSCKTPSPA